jgi:hypothetical protein
VPQGLILLLAIDNGGEIIDGLFMSAGASAFPGESRTTSLL